MAMGGKGLLIIAGKPKGKDMPADDEESPESEPGPASSGSEDVSLSRAFKAAQDGDEAKFKSAMRAAIETCVNKALQDEDY